MAKTLKVQDGNLVLRSIDQDISVDVKGQMLVGRNSTNDIITTANNANLIISTTGGAHMILSTISDQVGVLEINNVQWPDNFEELSHGSLMFVEYDAVDQQFKLRYRRVVLGQVSSDSLSNSDLNQRYPTAHNGNIVIGPSVMYLCLGNGTWVTRSGSGGGGSANSSIIGNVNSDSLTSAELNNQFPSSKIESFVLGPTVVYMKVTSAEWRRLGYPVGDPIVLTEVPYDLAYSFHDAISANTVLGSTVAVREMNLSAGLLDSQAHIEVAPNQLLSVDIIKISGPSESTIGSISWAANSNVGQFSLANDVLFSEGDVIKLAVSSTQPALSSGSGVSVTLVAWLPVV